MSIKELTINQLAKEVFVSNVTLRTWLMKPVIGEAYDPNQLNYKNMQNKLLQLYPDFEERFKFNIEDIVILRREKAENKYIQPDQLKNLTPMETYITLKNYNLNTKLQFVKCLDALDVNGLEIFIFLDDNGKAKAYTKEQLESSNYRMELIIEEDAE